MKFILLYVLGLLFTCNTCLIWFYSPLKITLGQLLFDKDIYTVEQFETRLLIRNAFLGKLLTCYICFSFWTALLVGAGFAALHLTPFWFIAITAGTYPCLCYLYKLIVEKF